MKTLLFVSCFLLHAVSSAQIDSLPVAFFPHSVGNVWQYASQGGGVSTGTLTRDSVVGGTTFLFYNDDTIPAFSIDSSLNVVYYPTFSPWRSLRYKLNANPMQWWIVQDQDTTTGRPAVIARVESTFFGSLFGVPTQMKAIGFYFDQGDTTILFWRNEEYLAAGFGYFLSFTDPPWTPYEELVGCIIDGVRYGTLVSVPEVEKPLKVPLLYKLYPSFPNPFNPSTTISYSLAQAGKISLTVYDVLGRQVSNLVNESQDAGFHSVFFHAENLPSGVYFAKLTVSGQIGAVELAKVNKLLLMK